MFGSKKKVVVTIDSAVADIVDKIEQLEDLEVTHSQEATMISATIASLQVKAKEEEENGDRAKRLAAKFRELIS